MAIRLKDTTRIRRNLLFIIRNKFFTKYFIKGTFLFIKTGKNLGDSRALYNYMIISFVKVCLYIRYMTTMNN